MNEPRLPALALSGSNVTGNAPFSAALRTAGGIAVASTPPGARGDLAVLARSLCADAGVLPAELRELRLDLGPGSYTGLRVAVTFARIVQRFAGVPVLACDSLAAMAAAAAAAAGGAEATLRPVLDARRERFHTATFRFAAGALAAASPPAALPLDALRKELRRGEVVLAAAPLHALLAADAARAGAVLREPAPVDAATLFLPSLPLQQRAPDALEPLYLMGSYAE